MKHLFLSLAFFVLFFTACSQVDDYSSFDESAKQPSYNISLSEISRIDFSGIVSPQTKAGGLTYAVTISGGNTTYALESAEASADGIARF